MRLLKVTRMKNNHDTKSRRVRVDDSDDLLIDEEGLTRFSFGRNWRAFLEQLDKERIIEAERSIQELTGLARMDEMSFIDVGSGSGLFSLAARRLGAKVVSFDYDEDSVASTQMLRDRYCPGDASWKIERGSILDLAFVKQLGLFDIVYSWGVLHHTGAMNKAIHNGTSLVRPGGIFVFALYRKTRLCWLWKWEKRWYASASPTTQNMARASFIGLFRLACQLQGRDFLDYVAKYKSKRGMSFVHDVHDWMGGYPYESIKPDEVSSIMSRLGFEHVRSITQPYSSGLFGSGCDEFVFRRV